MEAYRPYDPTLLLVARESRGLSQKELAEKSGLSQTVISHFENGNFELNDDNLLKLAEVLRYPPSFFQRRLLLYNPNNQLWRKRSGVAGKALKKAQAKMNLIKADIDSLLTSVDLPVANLINWDIEMQGDAVTAARELRRIWRLPKGRVDDLTKLVEDNGIIIVLINYEEEGLDGMNVFASNNTPIIFIDRGASADRYRISLAHELGHLVMHCGGKPIGVDRDPEEEAWTFACEFLMPQDEIRPQLQRLNLAKLADLKRQWKISMAAILMWAKKMSYPPITPNQYRGIVQQMNKIRTVEPTALNFMRESPALLNEMIDAHTKELGYSEEQMMRLFHVKSEDFHDRYSRAKELGSFLRIVR